ncbi:uncharacterized protein LOC134538387 [Bacillus rossius redtenbacheri]|uniref:uncharacterized protein LOC134538387 n=1 Tax=Bacillus rossius redtenbacheri TaxID=93214 RepID=UPI002FDE822D
MDSGKQRAVEAGSPRRRFLDTELPAPATKSSQQGRLLHVPRGWTMFRHFSCKQLIGSGGRVSQVTHEQIRMVTDTGNVHYFSSTNSREGRFPSHADKGRKVRSLDSRDTGGRSTSSGAGKQSPASAGQNCSFEKFQKLWLACCMSLLLVAGFFLFRRLAGPGDDACRHTLRTDMLERVFKHKLFGQERASVEIVTQLTLFSISDGPRVEAMVFYGGTGVGKSYAASLISKYFTWPRNIQYVIPSVAGHSVSSADEVLSNLSPCGDNLVIMDGLSVGQERAGVKFLDELSAASISRGFRVILILIFNIQQRGKVSTENQLMIESMFKIRACSILFQPLQEQHVKKCVKEALSQQGISMSNGDVDHLISVLMPLRTGCKSVASKVAVAIR